ncbi:hypothetical protein N9W00_01500 [Arcobacteraceae bacterium]|nr:hypothetical protein [Arcobacteraceae bacterium]
MHKKLTKYIESYDAIQDSKTYELKPNGGMIVLINQDTTCEVIIEEHTYLLESYQTILINAYTHSVEVKSNDTLKPNSYKIQRSRSVILLRRIYG